MNHSPIAINIILWCHSDFDRHVSKNELFSRNIHILYPHFVTEIFVPISEHIFNQIFINIFYPKFVCIFFIHIFLFTFFIHVFYPHFYPHFLSTICICNFWSYFWAHFQSNFLRYFLSKILCIFFIHTFYPHFFIHIFYPHFISTFCNLGKQIHKSVINEWKNGETIKVYLKINSINHFLIIVCLELV